MSLRLAAITVACFTLAGCGGASSAGDQTPATTRPQTPDERFLSELKAAGVDVIAVGPNKDGEPPEVWAPRTGRFDCEMIEKYNDTPNSIARTSGIGTLSSKDVLLFAITAVKVYCPELG